MKKIPIVSIIVLNWNGKSWLEECLSSIYKQSFRNFEVILADNNSSDDSIEYTKKNWPGVKILKLSKDFGYAGGNNRAARTARGEFILFLTNDVKIPKSFLKELYTVAKEKKTILFCPRMLNYNGKEVFPKDKKYSGMGKYGYPIPAKQPFYVDGAALFMEKSVFEELGGFDEDYFMFQEDVDLSWRARLLGYKIVPLESAKIFHFGGGTVVGSRKNNGRHKTSTLRRYHTEKNALSNLLKNYEFKNIIYVIPVFLILGWGEAFLYLLTGQVSGSIAILRAHLWNLINLGKILAKRRKIQKTRKVSDKEILKHISRGSGKWKVFKSMGVPKLN